MLIEKLATLAGIAVAGLFLASPASALTMAECSAKYQAAKAGGTLNGETWNQFRKAECGTDASASADTKSKKATTASASAQDAAAKGLTTKECSAKYQAAKAAGTLNGMKWNAFRKAECGAGASATSDTGAMKATKAAASDNSGDKGLTMAECSAKYQAAKTAGTLNGMKWNAFRKAECGAGASATATARKASVGTADDGVSNKGLTMSQCSTKYQAAKTAGTLNGMKWNDFRKAQCGAGASEDDTVPAVDEATYTGEPDAPKTKAPRGVKFPSSIAKKYAAETAGKARMHTCLDQYYANKYANSLNGLKWIQKGGGYYSLCNARLKGSA